MFSLCPFAPENLFGLARRVQPSRPAPACSFSILRLNRMLTHGMPPDFRAGVHLFSKKGLRGITTQVLNIFGIRVNEEQWRATLFGGGGYRY